MIISIGHFKMRKTLFPSQLAQPAIESFIHLAFPGLLRLVQVDTFEDKGVFGLLLEMREIFPDPSLVGTKGGNSLAREVRLPQKTHHRGCYRVPPHRAAD